METQANSTDVYSGQPTNLVMTKRPVIEITTTDAPHARIPTHILIENNMCPVSDEAHRRYWKCVIGTYLMHEAGFFEQMRPDELFRIRKFPAGYELYMKDRPEGSTRTPDHYLYSFDRHGERDLKFDSPYVFVLHAKWLAYGRPGQCPCSVCSGDHQRDIRRELIASAPEVTIPGIVRFKNEVENRSR